MQRALLIFPHLLVEIKGDVTELFLDIAHDFPLGRSRELDLILGQKLHHVLRQVAAPNFGFTHGLGHNIALVHHCGVARGVAHIEHHAHGFTGRVHGERSRVLQIQRRHGELLEHDQCRLLAVGLRVPRGLGQQHGMLLGRHPELVVERVVPHFLHLGPRGHDAVLDRALELQDATLGVGLVADVFR